MGKRPYAWFAPLAIVGMLASGVLTYTLRRTPLEVRITESEVQRQIDAHLPRQGKHDHVQVEVSRVTIDIREEGLVGFVAELKLGFFGTSVNGRVEGTAVPEYREGAFYLTRVKTTNVAIDQFKLGVFERRAVDIRRAHGEALDETRIIRNAVPPLVERLFDGYPVYRVKDTWKGNLTKRLLRSIRVEGDVLIAELRLG